MRLQPNGDGMNDNFRPLHACDMQDYSMTIFKTAMAKRFTLVKTLWMVGMEKQKGTLLNGGGYVWMVTYTKNKH